MKHEHLPKGWRIAKLKEFLTQEHTYINELEDKWYPRISVKWWAKGAVVDKHDYGPDVQMTRHQLAKPGQIIVSEIWAKHGSIGIIPPDGEGALITSHFFLFDVTNPELEKQYVDTLVLSNYFMPQCAAQAKGSTGYASIRPDNFLICEFPLPPIDEQRRIAAVLRDADANIAHVEAQIDAANKVKRGVMQQLFTYGLAGEGAPTQETKIGDIPQHWQIVRLRAITSESKKRNSKQNYDGKQVLSVSNEIGFFVSDRELPEDLSRYKLVKHKYFGYNPMRLNVGSIAFREEPETGMISPDYVVFRCDEKQLAPEYLDQFRRSFGWERQIQQGGTGSVRIRYYYRDIALFFIPLPPYDEQCEIVAILQEHDHIITALEHERDRLTEVKRGLMQKLLSGEVRV